MLSLSCHKSGLVVLSFTLFWFSWPVGFVQVHCVTIKKCLSLVAMQFAHTISNGFRAAFCYSKTIDIFFWKVYQCFTAANWRIQTINHGFGTTSWNFENHQYFIVKVFKLLHSNLLKISSHQLWIHGSVLKVTKPWILLCKSVNGCTATSWKFQTINNVPQRSCCVLQSLSCAGYLVWGCPCSGASLAPACLLHSRLWDCFWNCQKQVVVSFSTVAFLKPQQLSVHFERPINVSSISDRSVGVRVHFYRLLCFAWL